MVERFDGLTGIAVSVTIVRLGLGILGGPKQTIPRGELAALSAALSAERPKHWILVTDHFSHVRGWRKGPLRDSQHPVGGPMGRVLGSWRSPSQCDHALHG